MNVQWTIIPLEIFVWSVRNALWKINEEAKFENLMKVFFLFTPSQTNELESYLLVG